MRWFSGGSPRTIPAKRSQARTFSSLALVATLGSLLAAGCGGGKASALAGSTVCNARVGASSNANGVLWAHGRGNLSGVYAIAGTKVITPMGSTRVPPGSIGVGFWSCSPYELLYERGGALRMSGVTGPETIGTNGVAAPDGSFLTYHGSTLSYRNGEKLVVRGLDPSWKISAVAVDPANPHIALVNAEAPMEAGECQLDADAAVYRVAPSGTSTVLEFNPCRNHPHAAWSPDGMHMSYVNGPGQNLYIADAFGQAPVSVATGVSTYLWSPDGSRIAYDAYSSRTPRVALVDVATGASRTFAAGTLGAWSPDGKDVAVISGPSLMSVPAAGGRSHKLASLS